MKKLAAGAGIVPHASRHGVDMINQIECRNPEPRPRLRRLLGRAVVTAMAVLCAVAGLVATAPGTARADQAPSFVHWAAAGPSGATGTLSGASVTLAGPMGTAFYLHDDYPNFNWSAFTPQLPATGMVEIVGGAGHTFTLTFGAPVQNPVMMLGSLGSIMTFPSGTSLTRVSGDSGFQTNGRVVTGTTGPTDSNGTIRLNGTFTSITFTLVPNFTGGNGLDGVFLQVGGTR